MNTLKQKYETTNYEKETIIIINKQPAEYYTEIKLTTNYKTETGTIQKSDQIEMGIFLNKNMEIIGINTKTITNIYNTDQLLEILEKHIPHKDSFLYHTARSDILIQYWNTLYDQWNKIDKTIQLNELEEYFIKTIDDTWDNGLTYTYYHINPSISLDLKIKDTTISLFLNDIYKILVSYEEKTGERTIIFYDENNKNMEDVYIETIETPENIKFIFDKDDLEHSATQNNQEIQSFIKLYDKLNPYNKPDENKKILREWLQENNTLNLDVKS